MREVLEKAVLKGVSRSFYLTLRMLPAPMRDAASLGYLLARTSDTLADTSAAPLMARLQSLEQFSLAISGKSDVPRWSISLVNSVDNPRERRLLECTEDLFKWLASMPAAESDLIRKVVTTIISGQRLDLDRFGNSTEGQIASFDDDAMLDDYAWRVAGCVGEFWTKLGILTIGRRFSDLSEVELVRLAVNYGKALQLVNILRDFREDLANGRCYLPVADPSNREALLLCHRKWCEQAGQWITDGKCYASALSSHRLRAASVLPALLAEKTLTLIAEPAAQDSAERVKISRIQVYRSLFRALFR